MKTDGINLQSIREKAKELSKYIIRTPTTKLNSQLISELLGNSEVFLKLECLQHTGTFKARGALSVARQIPIDEKKFGITAASAGNHAIASAWAAKQLGMSAHVVM